MNEILKFWGLKCQPFPRDASQLTQPFLSTDLKKAKAICRYSIAEKGICLLTGDLGTGVSYATYSAAKDVDQTSCTVKYMPVCHVSPRDFYNEACRTTDAVPCGKGRQAMISAIRATSKSLKQQGRPLILILDNAQNIPDLAFRDLITLLCEDYFISPQMTMILCGTRELLHIFRQNNNSEALQHMTAHYEFNGLSEDETAAYVREAFKNAGASRALVDEKAFSLIYSFSSAGTFRDINSLMRDALLIGMQAKRNMIDEEVIRSAAAHRTLQF